MAKKLFVSVLFSLVIIFGAFASITVVEDDSNYSATKIVNGSFTSKPWMTYVYNNVTYGSNTDGYADCTPSSITPNGVNGGWNTTESSTYCGNLFEWSGNGNVYDHFYVSNEVLAANGRYFVDMNCNTPGVLYQDLSTNPGDVIMWTLEHAPSIRGASASINTMHVEVGAPIMNGETIVQPTAGSTISANITSASRASYNASGITGDYKQAYCFGDSLVNLSVPKSGDDTTVAAVNNLFKKVSGVYVIPEGQTVTRFAFMSDDLTNKTCGNMLSNITFTTLIGNLHGNYNNDGSISIYGHWGETDPEKKLVVRFGSIAKYIDMTDVLDSDFKITISKDEIAESVNCVDVFHQDYECAKKTIHIHNWTYVASGQVLKAYCSNTECADQCTYQGISKAVSVTLATNLLNVSARFNPASADAGSITWTSSDTTVAKINAENGALRSVSAGTTTITANATNGSAKATTVSVTVLPEASDVSVKVSGLELNKTSVSLNVGQDETLVATASPENATNKTVTWMSADSTIAKVNSTSGAVKGVSPGSTYITAIANDGSGKTASCLVTVNGGGQSGQGGQGGTGDNSSTKVVYDAANLVSSGTTLANGTYTTSTADTIALLVNTSSAVTITTPTVTKSGSSNGGDNCNFYGQNAAVLVKGGSTTTITGGTVTSDATGANGVFSYGGNGGNNGASGDGTKVIISGTKINTYGSGSGGIMTTGGGVTEAENLTITTSGASSAAIRTDRGGGTVTVDGGTYTTNGLGSPAIYSTADITVSNATLVSNKSEGVCIEGKNSITLTDCDLTANNSERNGNAQFLDTIMIYQSMSGDSSTGTSEFNMTGGTLTSKSGHVFHVTNTTAEINLNNVSIVNNDSDQVLLSVCDDGWSGASNIATVNATNQTLSGTILVGSDSTLTLNLKGTSTFSGSFSGNITNEAGTSVSTSLGNVTINLYDSATYTGSTTGITVVDNR